VSSECEVGGKVQDPGCYEDRGGKRPK
jgi:hypothetical protein